MERDALGLVTPWIESGKAVAIVGLRRAGKTTLLRQLARYLLERRRVPARDVFYVNLEDPVFIDSQRSPSFLDDLLQTYLEHSRPGGVPYLLLDEIQNVEHWARWVRAAVDRGSPRVFLTGSSSRLLEPELASVLTGRHRQITLWPFSFREVCRAKHLPLETASYTANDERLVRVYLADYLQHGGLPEVVLAKEPEIRRQLPKDLFRDVLHRDIIARHAVRSTGSLEELAHYLLVNTSQTFAFNRLKDRFGLGIDQVRSYIEYFEQCYLIGQLPKFDSKVALQQRAPRKAYATDPGLRNAVAFRFSQDLGWLAETVVYRQLRETALGKLFYFLGQQECDFVVWEGDRAAEAIQVCYAHDSVPDRERRGLLQAMETLGLERGLILTDSLAREDEVDGRLVLHVPLWRWLLEHSEPAEA